VVLLGLVAAARAWGMTERGLGVRAGLAGRIPVELAVLALAGWSLRRLTTHGAPVATGLEPSRIDLLLLAFPLLFLTGLVGLALRLLSHAVPRLRTAGASWPHALYLAARRLGSSARLALLLLGGSSSPTSPRPTWTRVGAATCCPPCAGPRRRVPLAWSPPMTRRRSPSPTVPSRSTTDDSPR
jgi:hypothetical protein